MPKRSLEHIAVEDGSTAGRPIGVESGSLGVGAGLDLCLPAPKQTL